MGKATIHSTKSLSTKFLRISPSPEVLELKEVPIDILWESPQCITLSKEDLTSERDALSSPLNEDIFGVEYRNAKEELDNRSQKIRKSQTSLRDEASLSLGEDKHVFPFSSPYANPKRSKKRKRKLLQ